MSWIDRFLVGFKRVLADGTEVPGPAAATGDTGLDFGAGLSAEYDADRDVFVIAPDGYVPTTGGTEGKVWTAHGASPAAWETPGAGADGVGLTFIYDDGATPSGNVYGTFATAHAAAIATGAPFIIQIPNGGTVTAGTYAIPAGSELQGASRYTELFIANGAALALASNGAASIRRLVINSNSTDPAFSVGGAFAILYLEDAEIKTQAEKPIDGAGVSVEITMLRSRLWQDFADLGTDGAMTIVVGDGSTLDTDAVYGSGTATLTVNTQGTDTSIGEQTGFSGTLQRYNYAPADRLVFNAGGSDGGNVFTTWPRLFAAIPTGAPVDIYFPAGTHTIPSGTWTLPEGSTLRGAGQTITTVNLDEGCDLRASSLTLEGLRLSSLYAHTMTVAGAPAYLTTRDVYIVGEALVIDASAGTTILLSDRASFGAKAIDLNAGGTLGLIAGDGTVVGASAIHGLGSATLSIGLAGLAVSLPASFSPAFTGILTPYASAFSAHGKKIADLADPTSAQDAATKAYADGLIVNASNTVKGVAKLSAAPVSPTDPIAVGDNDSRMTNARTPTSHASSHQNGGGDEIATATAGANAIPKAGGAGTLAIGWIPTGTSSSTVCVGDDSRLSDSRAASSVSESVLRTSAAGLTAALAVNSQKITGVAAGTASGDALIYPASSARGDILRHDGTNWTRLAAGTAGQVLQTGGAGADPSWGAAGGGGYTIGTTATILASSPSVDTSADTTDGPVRWTWQNSAAIWRPRIGGTQGTKPPAASAFTSQFANGGTIVDTPSNGTASSLFIQQTTAASSSQAKNMLWTHSTAFTSAQALTVCLDVAALHTALTAGYTSAGIALRESGTGKILTLATGLSGAAGVYSNISFTRWTTSAGVMATPADVANGQLLTRGPLWLRITDGTNLTAAYSVDGVNFINLASTVARTTAFTTAPDQAALYLNPYDRVIQATIYSWNVA